MKTTWLLDGNILIASAISTHPNHDSIRKWREGITKDTIASCSITEGTLLRLHMIAALDQSAQAAWSALEALHSLPNHVFWEEGFSYTEVSPKHIQGHKQITDAWLATLARRKGARLATFDKGLATAHPDVATLIPT